MPPAGEGSGTCELVVLGGGFGKATAEVEPEELHAPCFAPCEDLHMWTPEWPQRPGPALEWDGAGLWNVQGDHDRKTIRTKVGIRSATTNALFPQGAC